MAMVPVVGTVGVDVEPRFTGTQRAIAKEYGAAAEKAGKPVGSRLGGAIGAGVKVAGGAVLGGLGVALTKGFGRLQAIETATAKLTGLGHSAESVEKIMANANAAVKGTAFGLDEAATVSASLVASGIKPGNELESSLRLVSDAATIAGTDMSSMGSIFGKVAASGKIQGDTLAQLSDAGIPIVQLLSQELGVSAEETYKLASEGKINFETFSAAMQDGMGGAALKSGDTLQGAFSNTLAAVGRIGANLLTGVYPLVTKFFQGMIEWLKPLEEGSKSAGIAIGVALGGAVNWLSEAFSKLDFSSFSAFLDSLGGVGGGAFASIGSSLQTLMPAFREFAAALPQIGAAAGQVASFGLTLLTGALSFLADHVDTIIAWMPAIIAGFVAWRVASAAMAKGTMAMQAAQLAMTPVITLNNVLRITAIRLENQQTQALIASTLAQQGNNTATNVGIIGKTRAALATAAMRVGTIASTVATVAQTAAQRALNAVMKANPIMLIVGLLTLLVGAVVYAYNNFSWFRTIVDGAWNGIKAAAKWAWEGVLQPIFQAISGFITGTLVPKFELFRDVIGVVWTIVSNKIRDTWNNNIKPIFTALGNFITDHVVPVFQKGVDGIKRVWESIKEFAKKPIQFVIDTVINKGLIGAFNTVAGWIPGVDKLDPISIPGFDRGGYTGPGSKYQPAGIVHADEFVIRKESQQDLRRRAPGLLDRLNQFGASALGYAKGGLVHPMGPRHRSVSAGWYGYPGHQGVDYPAPVGTPVHSPGPGVVSRTGWNLPGGTGKQVWINHANGLLSRVHHLADWLVKAGQNVTAGQVIGRVGMTGNTTGPHAHWGVMDGSKYLNPATIWGSGRGGSGDFYGGGGGFDPLGALTGLVGKLGGWFSEQFPGGGMLVDLAKGVGGKLITDITSWVSDKIGGIVDWGGDVIGNAGTAVAKGQVRGAAALRGWGAGAQWDALSALIQKESGWNMHAANPKSSARGLFQKMTSLHGEVEGTALGQANWGLGYIKDRYGSPVNAWNHHKRYGSYAGGGLVQPVLRDNGGELPRGLNMILNNRRESEWIVNKPQVDRMARNFANRPSTGNTYSLYVDKSKATADDMIQAIEFYDRRAARV